MRVWEGTGDSDEASYKIIQKSKELKFDVGIGG